MKPIPKDFPAIALGALLALHLGQALAAGGAKDIDAQYQHDRQACAAVQGGAESREACLREAGAVRQAALRGTMNEDVSPAERRNNALSRCDVHQDAVDRAACLRMASGEGVSQGSVAAGGIIRETITVLPLPEPATQGVAPAH